MKPTIRLRISRTHRLLGMIATVPLLGWVVSSFVLHGVGLALPNGLQGVYEMKPYGAVDVLLEDSALLGPSAILKAAGVDGLDRAYWLRLEAMAGNPIYVVKPGPFDREWVYDGRTGARLDPLSDEALRRIGDNELVGTWVESVRDGSEFNRYYTEGEIPSVVLRMEGEQPSDLVLSRASGRTLRRTDPLASWFDKAYKSIHVWQWGDNLYLFTAVLYSLVGLTLLLVGLGFFLWFDRRPARRRWSEKVRPARRLHARLGPLAGVILVTQALVGAYLWFNLGLIEPRFRGQGSFETEWSGGISIDEVLPEAELIAGALPHDMVSSGRPIQRYEWRAIGGRRFWLAYPQRNGNGVLLDGDTGAHLERLTPDLARVAGEAVVLGAATGTPAESEEYWMDFNAIVPTYLFRFDDPDNTDVHVSQITGEVVQRRPAIWRAFGAFLLYHTFGLTGNPVLDTILLTILQVIVLGMAMSGWRLAALKTMKNAS